MSTTPSPAPQHTPSRRSGARCSSGDAPRSRRRRRCAEGAAGWCAPAFPPAQTPGSAPSSTSPPVRSPTSSHFASFLPLLHLLHAPPLTGRPSLLLLLLLRSSPPLPCDLVQSLSSSAPPSPHASPLLLLRLGVILCDDKLWKRGIVWRQEECGGS